MPKKKKKPVHLGVARSRSVIRQGGAAPHAVRQKRSRSQRAPASCSALPPFPKTKHAQASRARIRCLPPKNTRKKTRPPARCSLAVATSEPSRKKNGGGGNRSHQIAPPRPLLEEHDDRCAQSDAMPRWVLQGNGSGERFRRTVPERTRASHPTRQQEGEVCAGASGGRVGGREWSGVKSRPKTTTTHKKTTSHGTAVDENYRHLGCRFEETASFTCVPTRTPLNRNPTFNLACTYA